MALHHRQRMRQVIRIAVIEGESREEAGVRFAQPDNRLVETDEFSAVRLEPSQRPVETSDRMAQQGFGIERIVVNDAMEHEDHAAAAIASRDRPADA